MISKSKIAVAVATVSVTVLPMVAGAAGFASPADASNVVSTFVGDVGTVLETSLPGVLAIAASLLGVMILWRFLRRTVK